ncbi:glutathione peroxidase 3 [Lingula anatina]|uniref:Glutathione peroxidase n=1 Tax=Lingula anatina TaxID=7574 RepID=A0A1S3HEV0_LINAN|nr:glutathione peroxidase 3 [Lingula anatina]|eukprot:XP_013384036.2 glutathione peroxidase 3 [Lingula anatina]
MERLLGLSLLLCLPGTLGQISQCDSSKGSIHQFTDNALADNRTVGLGRTPQYFGLNALVQEHGRYFDIIGYPCNQFGLQEPGENATEIFAGLKFVRPGKGFQPNFILMAKTEVNGPNENPVYTFLKSACPPATETIGDPKRLFWTPIKVNDITWNFEKFLLDHFGRPRYRVASAVNPLDPRVKELVSNLVSQARLGNQSY